MLSRFKDRKYAVWVTCPNCGQRWLVSKIEDVKVDCDCGKVFIYYSSRKEVKITGEKSIRKRL